MDLLTMVVATYLLLITSDVFLLIKFKQLAEVIEVQHNLINFLRSDVKDLEHNVKVLNRGVFKV